MAITTPKQSCAFSLLSFTTSCQTSYSSLRGRLVCHWRLPSSQQWCCERRRSVTVIAIYLLGWSHHGSGRGKRGMGTLRIHLVLFSSSYIARRSPMVRNQMLSPPWRSWRFLLPFLLDSWIHHVQAEQEEEYLQLLCDVDIDAVEQFLTAHSLYEFYMLWICQWPLYRFFIIIVSCWTCTDIMKISSRRSACDRVSAQANLPTSSPSRANGRSGRCDILPSRWMRNSDSTYSNLKELCPSWSLRSRPISMRSRETSSSHKMVLWYICLLRVDLFFRCCQCLDIVGVIAFDENTFPSSNCEKSVRYLTDYLPP